MIKNATEQSTQHLKNNNNVHVDKARLDFRVDPFAWHTNDPPDLCWDSEPICPFTMTPCELSLYCENSQYYENPRVPTYMIGFFWMSLEPCVAERSYQPYSPSEFYKKGGI